jgi:hypothetical protein
MEDGVTEVRKRSLHSGEAEARAGLLKLLGSEPMTNDQLSGALDIWYSDIRDLTVRMAEEGLIHGTVTGPPGPKTNSHVVWHPGPGPVPDGLKKRAPGVLPLFLEKLDKEKA